MIKTITYLILFMFFANASYSQDTLIVRNNIDYNKIKLADRPKLNKYFEAVKLYRKANDLKEVSKYLNAIANLYWTSKNYKNAIKYYDESMAVNTSLRNQNAIAGIHNFKGMIYADSKQYKQSINSFEKALNYYNRKRMKKDAINTRINISLSYSNLSQYDKATSQLEFAFLTAQELNDLEQIVQCAGLLSKAYEDAGNQEQSHFYFNIYKAFHEAKEREKQNVLKKSLKEVELQRQLTESEKKAKELELYKKQQEVSSKNKIIIEKDSTYSELLKEYSADQLIKKLYEENIEKKEIILKEERRTRRVITVALIIVLLLFLMIIFFFRRTKVLNKKLNIAYDELQRKNDTLIIQKEEILQQKEEIQAQRDEIEKQKDYVETQRDEIGIQRDLVITQRDRIWEQNRHITDSIQYAKRIQTAMLPPDELLEKLVPESFVLFMPRDIVSGDFYWATQLNGKTIIAAADCTGHGVPGAFMSMLGISFLNEIVNKREITKPSEILTILRDNVKKSLRQTGRDNEAKDGMDIALISIDFDNLELEFSGAYNPLYLYRENNIEVVKGDRMPIGIYLREKETFTNHEVKLQKNDRLYIFSDGYADQLGGEQGRKFMSRKFRQMLADNATNEMDIQKQYYFEVIKEWMAQLKMDDHEKNEQIDDILLMGIKI